MFALSVSFIAAQAANANKTFYCPVPGPSSAKMWLKSLVFIPDSDGAVSLDGTNYITVTAKNGSNSLGSFNTNTGGTVLVAGTAVAFSLSGEIEFTALTGALTVDSVKTGTGAVLKGIFVATFEQVHNG